MDAAVCLCFVAADRDLAARLAEALQRDGFAVEELELDGADFDAELTLRRLQQVGALLLVWTPASIASGLARDVARQARDERVLVNLLAGVGGTPPFPFHSMHATPFGEVGDLAWRRLAAQLGDMTAMRADSFEPAPAAAPPPMPLAAPADGSWPAPTASAPEPEPPLEDPVEGLARERRAAALTGAAPYAGAPAAMPAPAPLAAAPPMAASRGPRGGLGAITATLAGALVIGTGFLWTRQAAAPPPTAAAPEGAAPIPQPLAASHWGWAVGLALIVAAAAAAAIWLRRRGRTARSPAQAAVPSPAPPRTDPVDASAFAPGEVRPGGQALVQIYLHPVDAQEEASARARAADPQAQARGQTTLGLEIARGTRVDVLLDAGGLTVDEPVQSVVWQGRPGCCPFTVTAAAGLTAGPQVVTARFIAGGAPVGRLSFTLAVAEAADAAPSRRGLRGETARRYERAFLSYSSQDRPEVLKRAQALRAAGIGYFQDILSLEPGEAWRERLFAEIDRCDLFLLFWSSHAAASDWVRQEAEYALARRNASDKAVPDITPIILEGPPVPRPPPSLAALHFNDMLRYMVVATELEAAARR
jgi:hypothetical protein